MDGRGQTGVEEGIKVGERAGDRERALGAWVLICDPRDVCPLGTRHPSSSPRTTPAGCPAEQGKGINVIPHGQSSPGRGEVAQVHPGMPGPILQPLFPNEFFQGSVIKFPDLLQIMG